MPYTLIFAGLIILTTSLGGCSRHPGFISQMGERGPSSAQAEGKKLLVGTLDVRDGGNDPWPGSIEICLAPMGSNATPTCDYVAAKRIECTICKDQPDFEANRGYVMMRLSPGQNELREIRLTRPNMHVGQKAYTYYLQGIGFTVDDTAEVTNFGKLMFLQRSSPDIGSMALTINDVDSKDTKGLARMRQVVSGSEVLSVSTRERPIFVDTDRLRMQVKESTLVQGTTPVYMPMYIRR